MPGAGVPHDQYWKRELATSYVLSFVKGNAVDLSGNAGLYLDAVDRLDIADCRNFQGNVRGDGPHRANWYRLRRARPALAYATRVQDVMKKTGWRETNQHSGQQLRYLYPSISSYLINGHRYAVSRTRGKCRECMELRSGKGDAALQGVAVSPVLAGGQTEEPGQLSASRLCGAGRSSQQPKSCACHAGNNSSSSKRVSSTSIRN